MSSITAPTYEFTVEEYHKLAGVLFDEDDRVELLDGNILLMSPIGYRHNTAVRRLTNTLPQRLGNRCQVGVQSSLILDEKSEPEPDVVLLDNRVDMRTSSPTAEDVLLLIEVADSTLYLDRTAKKRAYARNSITEYWLLDLTRNQLIVHRDPQGETYQSEQVLSADESVSPLAFPDLEIQVASILPP